MNDACTAALMSTLFVCESRKRLAHVLGVRSGKYEGRFFLIINFTHLKFSYLIFIIENVYHFFQYPRRLPLSVPDAFATTGFKI
jgi:hypothetical protein